MIGIERKQKRLHYLKSYWMDKVKDLPGARLNTSLNPKWSCAIGNFGLDGKKPGELDSFLLDKYNIIGLGFLWLNVVGAVAVVLFALLLQPMMRRELKINN